MAKKRSEPAVEQGTCPECGESTRTFPNIDDGGTEVRSEVMRACLDIIRYINFKKVAEANREEGNVAVALKLEGSCENIYRALPGWAKW